jgi:hypothetical protein
MKKRLGFLDAVVLVVGAGVLFLALLFQPDWIWILSYVAFLATFIVSRRAASLKQAFLVGVLFSLTYSTYPVYLIIVTGVADAFALGMRCIFVISGVLLSVAAWGTGNRREL